MSKTLSVSAIQSGTVIDHIPSGRALEIMRCLAVSGQLQITLGLNLPSRCLGRKDLIKIENYQLNAASCGLVAVFAPQATVNLIEAFQLKEKKTVVLPKDITGEWVCSNLNCISNSEPVLNRFTVMAIGNRIQLACIYCEMRFNPSLLLASREAPI